MSIKGIEEGKSHWQEAMGVLNYLPPRHARGCPQNLVRSAMVQLTNAEIDVKARLNILGYLKDNLPCTCPKLEVEDATRRA